MKITLRRIAFLVLGGALAASPWLASSLAQDLRLKNQPTLAAPRSSVELRTAPTLSAQKQTGTTTAPTPTLPTSGAPTSTYSSGPAPTTRTYAPNSTTTSTPSSKWAPVSAAAPLAPTASTADPVSTPVPSSGETPVRLSVGTLSPTPEMWFYEQMRQDANNPELIVRRRAEQAAAERKARIASRAWYGVSLARPQAHVTPFMYHYSPTWTQNSRHPYSWAAAQGSTPVIIEARRPYVGVSGFGAW
jgi:hypothetical protein